jgi:putative endonuclease
VSPVRPKWLYTYVLISQKDNQFYTGVTENMKKRLQLHNAGLVSSTKNRTPFKLVYFEGCLDKNDAYRRERYLKTGMSKRFLKNRLKGGLTG